MQTELSVLRAIVRLSRRRSLVTLQALTLRGGGTHGDTVRALRFLVREGLADISDRGIRPTMAGLAIAVASARVVQVAAKRAPAGRVAPRALKVERSRRAA